LITQSQKLTSRRLSNYNAVDKKLLGSNKKKKETIMLVKECFTFINVEAKTDTFSIEKRAKLKWN
jgi:hypothetical protein